MLSELLLKFGMFSIAFLDLFLLSLSTVRNRVGQG
jgi:hypothetical protein